MMHTFTADKSLFNKDLQMVQKKVGGQQGTIAVGGVEHKNVLKLDDNLFVTTDPPHPMIQRTLQMEQIDLHHLRNGADIEAFKQTYRRFREGA